MIDGKKFLGVIAARGGSKGLPGKNIRVVDGKPLVAWSVDAAHKSIILDRVILSTDDYEIAEIARKWGCEVPFMRPAKLAGDKSRIQDALIHALDNVGEFFDYVVLLQAASPLRCAEDIDGCLLRCYELDAPACVTVTTPSTSPYLSFTITEDGRLDPLVSPEKVNNSRQELPTTYVLNGAVYAAKTDWYRKHVDFFTNETVGYLMSPENSVDIDTEADIRLMEVLLSLHSQEVN